MIWSASSVWRRWRVACCGLGLLGWGASITRLPSPGWSSRMPSGSARNCFQCNRPFRQSAADAVLWRSLLTTSSFTARSCSRCASFLKVTWFTFWMENSSSWKQQCGRNIMCFSAYSALLRVIIWTTRMKELYEDESFSSQTLVAFYKNQIKVKIWSERKRLSSLEFGKRWATVARLCYVIGASLIFNLDIAGT